jgi:HEAT repeat protein
MSPSRLTLVLIAALVSLATSPLSARQAQTSSAEQVEKCLAVLKSDATQKEKADACRELARIGGREAVAPLAALLADEKLSHMARYGLETIPDPSVDAALREAMGRLGGRLLAGVIGSIGVRQDAAAVPALAKLLRDPDTDVAQASARALGKIATPAAAKALQGAVPKAEGSNQLALCEGLFRCAETFAAKGRSGPATAIYDQLRALPVPHQVRTAAWRGAILTRKDGLPLLLEALHSDDFALFATGVRVSYELPGPGVTLALAGELEKASADRQLLLTQTLGLRADPKALPALSSTAQKGESGVRVAAIRSLAQLGDPTAGAVLFELLTDTNRDIAQAAQAALVGLPGKAIDASVLGRLAAKDSTQQLLAIDLIGRRRMVSAVPDLETAAGSGESPVRVAALKRLGGLAGPGELPTLLGLLTKSSNAEELDAAEQAVTETCIHAGNPDACSEKITASLPQVSAPQKCALLRSLSAVGGSRALKSVRDAVADPAAEVHTAAIRALAGWSSAEAGPDLLELARTAENPTDKMLCLRGYMGFASHADVPEPQRLEMCRQAASLVQRDDEKKLLLSALADINSPGALALIQPFLGDSSIREEACTAAVNLAEKILKGGGAAQAAPQLIDTLQKVAQATANSDVANRVKALLEKANAQAK